MFNRCSLNDFVVRIALYCHCNFMSFAPLVVIDPSTRCLQKHGRGICSIQRVAAWFSVCRLSSATRYATCMTVITGVVDRRTPDSSPASYYFVYSRLVPSLLLPCLRVPDILVLGLPIVSSCAYAPVIWAAWNMYRMDLCMPCALT